MIDIDGMDDDICGIIVACQACAFKQRVPFRQLCLDGMMHRAQIYQGVKRRKCPMCKGKLVIKEYLFEDGKIIDNPVLKSGKRREGW